MAYLAGAPIQNFTQPQLVWNTPAQGSNTVAVKHTVGCAWLMQRGVFLQGAGVDYTEDQNGFYLTTITADGIEAFGVLLLSPLNISNMLSATNPVIASGGLQFADGSVQTAAPRPNQNLIVDGQFTYASAASGAIAATAYSCLVMYSAGAGAGGAGTVSQGQQLGNIPGMTSPILNYATFAITTPSTGTIAALTAPVFLQRIESVRTLAGSSATFSCWLWTPSGTVTIPAIRLSQSFGSGGSPSPQLNLDKTVNWVVTTTPTRFSVRLDIPDIAGSTLGSNNNDSLIVGLWFPSNATYTVNTAQWQLEPSASTSSSDINGNGGSPRMFEWRGIQAEVARVMRYYEVVGLPALISNGSSSYGGAFVTGYTKATMRAYPAITLQSALSGNATGGLAANGYNDLITANFATVQALGNYYNGPIYICDARL